MAIFPQGLTNIDRRCANAGERALLHHIKRCLSDDYMVWHNTPLGPRAREPDFVILSPRQGILVLEVKHWKRQTLLSANRDSVELDTPRGRVTQGNPLRQARDYAFELVDAMQRDAALIHDEGPFRGKLLFPYGWGVVFSAIEEDGAGQGFHDVFPRHQVLMRDDLHEAVDAAAFQQRLWGMFTVSYPYTLSLPQRDRIRWHLFPELRVSQGALFAQAQESEATPADLMQVMDLQQEQVARTLGDGHRVIHGSAGSGKTMILVYRAQFLAAAARADRPILVLNYTRALADRIEHQLRARGVDERVVVRTFHGWCQDMVRSYQLDVPKRLGRDAYFAALARVVGRALETGLVPAGQYSALLIDEAHDFEDDWLRIAARLVDERTNSLLVLYDDAQSIYQKRRRKFNFSSVGIQAQGRTSILRMNYRNTAQILALAMHCAQSLLAQSPEMESEIQLVEPASSGRPGPLPALIEAQDAAQEADAVATRIANAVTKGIDVGDIAILCRVKRRMEAIAIALRQRGIAVQSMSDSGFSAIDWKRPSVKLLTLHSAKGLEFSVVVVAALDEMPLKGEPLAEELRLLYVGMTRATQELVLSTAGPSPIAQRVKNSLHVIEQHFESASPPWTTVGAMLAP